MDATATADLAAAAGPGLDDAGLENLLAPISEQQPSGESLRYDRLYDEIRELRREDDASLPQGVWKRELKRAEWDKVAAACAGALETRSKDLQIAGWLLEAWLHLEGFAGCERGLRLVRGLCERFWDDLHPRPEEGDADYRLAPLRWLAGRLPAMLRSLPVTAPEGEEATPCCWSDWEAGLHLAGLGEREVAAAEAEGKVTRARFLVGVSLTPAAYFAGLEAELEAAAAAVAALAAAVAERSAGEPAGFREARDVLAAIHEFARRVLAERAGEGEPSAGAEAAGDGDETPAGGAGAAPARPAGRIRSRAEAYQRLTEAADYLLRTEPHSPAPYLVKRAVTWGRLSLDELLAELLRKNTDLGAIYELLGMRPPERP